MKTYGPYVAARTLQQGVVSTVRGVDRVTGMPVLLFVFPRAHAEGWQPPVLDETLFVPYGDLTMHGDEAVLIAALPLSAHPATERLLSLRGALRALAWLHERGLTHGAPTPAHLWSSDTGVRLAGAGLPFTALGEGFDAPEGGRSAQTDLFTLGRTLQVLGGLPAELSHLLSTDPARRGAARQALEILESPRGPRAPGAGTVGQEARGVSVIPGGDPEPSGVSPRVATVPSALPTQAQGDAEAASPAPPPERLETPPVVVVASAAAVPAEAAPAQQEAVILIDDSFEAPVASEVLVIRPSTATSIAGDALAHEGARGDAKGSGAPAASQASSLIIAGLDATEGTALPRPAEATLRSPEASPRGKPIRIGWDEDDSWRVVKSGPSADGSRAERRGDPSWAEWLLSNWRYLAVVLLPLVVVAFFMTSGPREAPVECCRVQFEVRGAQNVRGRLEVVEAPPSSGLKAGALLSTVPGTVQFPNAPGRYTLRLRAEGYRAQTLRLQVPTRQPVIIEVVR